MDAYVKEIPVFREASSEQAFGAASLLPPDGTDLVPTGIFFRDPELRAEQEGLLRAAHGRLLGETGFPRVLDLLDGSERLVPTAAGRLLSRLLRLRAPALRSGQVDQERAFDLDAQQRLPFEDASFDAVLVTSEVGRLRRPLEVFRDIGRVLRQQGLIVVSFGPAAFDASHTRLWTLADDRERLMLAEAFIEFACAGFTRPTSLTLLAAEHGLDWREGPCTLDEPRVAHAHVVFAYRGEVAAAHVSRPPFPRPPPQPAKTREDIRFDASGRPCCPYCGERMGRYAPPVTIFEIDYGVSELDVCFNDRCEYYRRSKHWMRAQGHVGYTYRFMLNPETGGTGPIPDDLRGGLRSCRIDVDVDVEEQAPAPTPPRPERDGAARAHRVALVR